MNIERNQAESNHARKWIYERFGVDEQFREPPFGVYERKMEESGDDPRIVQTRADMRAQGFDMEENFTYTVNN